MQRYVVVLLSFLGYVTMYLLRVNLSVAIVGMTDKQSAENGTSEIEVFDWDTKQKGIILSSFFYGYIVTQFIGGFVATKYGGNIVFGAGIVLCSITSLLIPWIARTADVWGLVSIRSIQGLAQGIAYPGVHALYAHWAPVNEKSRMIAMTFCGVPFGTVLANMLSGVIAVNYGWPSIFYFSGTIGIIWYIFWLSIVRRFPSNDPCISETEKNYIISNIVKSDRKLKTPWKEILTSMPVWAIAITLTLYNWGFYTFITQLPSYLKETLNFDLASSGFIASLPFLVFGIMVIVLGAIADWIKVKEIISVTQIRKYFTCFGMMIQAILMIMTAYSTDPTICVVLITLAMGAGASVFPGFITAPLDLAPQYAGIIIGIANTFAQLPGIISPIATGFIVTESTVAEWRIVFYMTSSFYVIGAIIYWIFGSGELQQWAKKDYRSVEKEPKLYDTKVYQFVIKD